MKMNINSYINLVIEELDADSKAASSSLREALKKQKLHNFSKLYKAQKSQIDKLDSLQMELYCLSTLLHGDYRISDNCLTKLNVIEDDEKEVILLTGPILAEMDDEQVDDE